MFQVCTDLVNVVLLGLGVNSKVVEALLLVDTPKLNTSCGGFDDVTDTGGCEDGINFVVDSAAALENNETTEFSEETSIVFFSSFCSVLFNSETVWQASSFFVVVPVLFL